MQELVATAMENTGLPRGQRVARDVVNKYLQAMRCTFQRYNHTIFEKYDALDVRVFYWFFFQNFLKCCHSLVV